MNKQLEYLTPEVNVFTVQTEGVICQSLNYGTTGNPGADFNYNDYGIDF